MTDTLLNAFQTGELCMLHVLLPLRLWFKECEVGCCKIINNYRVYSLFVNVHVQCLLCNYSNPDTYWATTGLFPQEVVITLPSLTNLTGVTIKSTNGTCSALYANLKSVHYWCIMRFTALYRPRRKCCKVHSARCKGGAMEIYDAIEKEDIFPS